MLSPEFQEHAACPFQGAYCGTELDLCIVEQSRVDADLTHQQLAARFAATPARIQASQPLLLDHRRRSIWSRIVMALAIPRASR